MGWKEHYKTNTVSADEAVAMVSAGDNLAISLDPKPTVLMDALVSHHEQLKDLRIFDVAPHYDPGWLRADFEGSFRYSPSMFLGNLARSAYDERRIDFAPVIFSADIQPYREPNRGPRLDVTLVVCSPPDDHGFCSFGKSLWNKRSFAKHARIVLAQVDESLIRTYGDNYIHVSEIDRFVDHTPPELSLEESEEMISHVEDPLVRAELERLLPRLSGSDRYESLPGLLSNTLKHVREFARLMTVAEPNEDVRKIAQNVAELVRDGDTIQIGVGSPSSYLPRLGAFDQKRDLGWHSEMTAPGILSLIEEGVITGERKNVHTGIAVFTAPDRKRCRRGALRPQQPPHRAARRRVCGQHQHHLFPRKLHRHQQRPFRRLLRADQLGDHWKPSVERDRRPTGASHRSRAIEGWQGRHAPAVDRGWRHRLTHCASASGGGGGNRSPHLCRYDSNRVWRSPAARQIYPGEGS